MIVNHVITVHTLKKKEEIKTVSVLTRLVAPWSFDYGIVISTGITCAPWSFDYGTIIPTGITCKKIPCYICATQVIVENAKVC